MLTLSLQTKNNNDLIVDCNLKALCLKTEGFFMDTLVLGRLYENNIKKTKMVCNKHVLVVTIYVESKGIL